MKLPPFGFWVRERPRATVVRGWELWFGIATLQHGTLTFPIAAHFDCCGIVSWFLLSLFAAVGFGFRVVVDPRGFGFSRTWWFIPFTWRRFPKGTPFVRDDDPHAPDGADFAEWVRLGEEDGDEREFGGAANAAAICAALERAVERHHAERRSGHGGPYRVDRLRQSGPHCALRGIHAHE